VSESIWTVERLVDSHVALEPPLMMHIAGFSPDRQLCGASADPIELVDWVSDTGSLDCVVCAETWRSMTYAQRRALNIFWGGTA
jgi:hypothetical protein